MASVQGKLRKALGSFKDQTSISFAKVTSAGAPDLDIALVKATSHDEMPIEEKYVQEVLYLTSCSRGYVAACVAGLSRRLSKTRNWIVAIKTLILAHRLLREGDPAFELELKLSTLRGMSVLGVADFRDESHSNGWDFSAFVRAYGLYLDERLDCPIASPAFKSTSEQRPPRNEPRYQYSSGHLPSSRSFSYGAAGKDHQQDSQTDVKNKKKKAVKDMDLEDLMDKFPGLQRLVQRVLACRPSGAAKVNRLVHVALYGILRESFFLYADVRDGMAVLFDAFFDMREQHERSRAFDLYSRGARQVDELVSFYSVCKALGICKSIEYPIVEKVTEDALETMEDFLRNWSDIRSAQGRSAQSRDFSRGAGNESNSANSVKALMPPPTIAAANVQYISSTGENLLNLDQPPMTTIEEHENKLALALFSSSSLDINAKDKAKVNTVWETFSSSSAYNNQTSIVEQNQAATTGWELALIEGESDLSKPTSDDTLAGGFNQLLLDSLYDEGAMRQLVQAAAIGTSYQGSASSVATLNPQGRAQSSTMLALPAPPSSASALFQQEDPFAASINVAPPPFVQMAELRHKQELLVQEQQQWLQYQNMMMHGYLNQPTQQTILNNPFASNFQPTSSQYPVPYYSSSSLNYRAI